ncbi:MAG: L,D-transpeptidase family protein [Syntrophales bacterium]
MPISIAAFSVGSLSASNLNILQTYYLRQRHHGCPSKCRVLSLAEKYGYVAFVLNYPNFLDRKERKDGGGIWLHGHSAGKVLGADVPDTKGCIVVSNDALKEMSGYLKSNGTPIAIVNKLQFSNLETQKELAKELRSFINSWRISWESINTKKYMSFLFSGIC